MSTSERPGGYAQAVESDSRLMAFLYILMRDHLPPGVVEGIMVDHVEVAAGMQHMYSNDFLAAYAYEIEQRLQGLTPERALSSAYAVLRTAQGKGK
jgi:hypothetical protein